MQLRFAIFQRRSGPKGREIAWTPLGLPFMQPITLTESSKARLRDRMRKVLAETLRYFPSVLQPQLELPPGLELRRVRVDLRIEGAGGRRKVSGDLPLIFEPCRTGDDEEIVKVYHPMDVQESSADWHWFRFRGEDTLERDASRFYSNRWSREAEVFQEDESLLLDRFAKKQDSLVSHAFDIRTHNILDDLEELDLDDPFADLRGGGIQDRGGAQSQRRGEKPPLQILDHIAVDQTRAAAADQLEGIRPREPWRSRLSALLGGAQRRPLVLVGPAGAGKRCLLLQWVRDLLMAEDYPSHRNLERVTHVWALRGERIIAGMRFLGAWEERCTQILQDVRNHRAALLVDDLHAWGRLGHSRNSERSFADFFRGPLQQGRVLIIGTATPSQWARLEEDAPAFANQFMQLRVEETAPAETLELMVHEVRRIEQRRDLLFAPSLYQECLELGGALFGAAANPGRSLDLLRALDRRAPLAENSGDKVEIGRKELLSLLSSRTGLPPALLDSRQPLDVGALRRTLRRRVRGQDPAIEVVVDLQLRIRAGLVDPRRPYSVYLFTGPTGTGKTELARALAASLYGDEARLNRFDMSEFGGPDAVPRLIGDRYEPAGLLTRAVRQQPFCVLLLDEIEKAHPAVHPLLLQLFEDGRLTDAGGETTDFRQCVVIMTSNLGARQRSAMGFVDSPEALRLEVSKAVREFFAPELFNRIDRIVSFAPLSTETAAEITHLGLARLFSRRGVAQRRAQLVATAGVVDEVVTKAFDPRDGARPLKRYLEREIGGLLSDHFTGHSAGAVAEQLFLYRSAEGIGLHAEQMLERPTAARAYPIAGLEEANPAELLDALVPEREALRALAESDALQDVSERIRETLGDGSGLSAGAAELVYYLDLLRGRIDSVARRISWLREQPRKDRQALLATFAEARFLHRLVTVAERPESHRVLLELSPLGDAVSLEDFELLEQLRNTYRAAVSEVAEGEVLGEAEGGGSVLLDLAGLGLGLYLAGETGSHIYRAYSGEQQAVRVECLPLADGNDARATLKSRRAAVQDFEAALDQGRSPLPANPRALLPVVRRLGILAPREGGPSVLEVADLPTGYLAEVRSDDFSAALRPVWRRNACAEPEASP